MIEAFGNYHRIFWNCQIFAKCFLKVICEEPAEFDAWTIAEASNLVAPLSAPSIPLPFLQSITTLRCTITRSGLMVVPLCFCGHQSHSDHSKDQTILSYA